MVAELIQSGVLVSPAIIHAMLDVPRHLFLGDIDHRLAYEDRPVIVLRDAEATPISSASQPAMVAAMLEQLHVVAGNNVLEIGTGTGYNAALLAALVGGSGTVVSVEIEPQLAARAAEALAAVGPRRVTVVIGDGKAGYPMNAPYDRIIVTAGAFEVAAQWTDQLIDGGRLAVPLVDRHGVGSVVVFDKVGDRLVRRGAVQCRFLLLRDDAIEPD
jgi:protein-L-isoaspartate(D-aspartate) O-methyltransferase